MVDSLIFPQLYRNAEGVELEARDEVQAYVFEREGFTIAGETKRSRKPKTDE